MSPSSSGATLVKSRLFFSRAASALFLPLTLAFAAPAPAQQDYPARPIRLITAAAQGGTSDILARTFAVHLTEALKQPVVVDNRASASGVIAGELTANASADGYTLLLAYHQHTVNAALNPKLPYHPVNSFTPITQLTTAGFMLVVNPATPVKNLQEFVEWTRNFKGPLNYGSAGIGTGGHLAGELYKMMTGVKAEHIPYKGSGPALMDLMAGQYHFNFSGMQSVQTLVRRDRAGRAAQAHRHAAARRARQDSQPARHTRAHRGRRLGACGHHARGISSLYARRPRQMGQARQGERSEAGLKCRIENDHGSRL